MAVFVATSKRYHDEAKEIVDRLRASGPRVYHPDFDLDPAEIEADPERKREVTLRRALRAIVSEACRPSALESWL